MISMTASPQPIWPEGGLRPARDRAATGSLVPRLKPVSDSPAPAARVSRPADPPARRQSRAARVPSGAGVIPEGQARLRRRARSRPARPMASSQGAAQRAGLAVIRLAADDTELRQFVERSQAGAELAVVPTPSWHGDGVPQATAASQPDGSREAGILVLSRRGHARYALEQLTDREQEVLALMAQGRSNNAIADQLSITEHTVEKHIKNIFAALWLAPSPHDHRRVVAVLTYLTAVADD